jgi:putative transposase
MIKEDDRHLAVQLIKEHSAAGIPKQPFCAHLGISYRTYQRWSKSFGTKDLRVQSKRIAPANKLSDDERNRILALVNVEKYRDVSPCKMVPLLADEGIYMASESTFYRLLREAKQLLHRGVCKPRTHHKPKACIATAPNQVWSWDITYLPASIKGQYFYLYMIMDIFSRKVVGFHVHEAESAVYASRLITEAYFNEKIKQQQLVLHSDNGAPMKGLTMRATLEKLGVVPSFSRPSVSDDNPFSESLFKTLKYHPTFPRIDRFDDIAIARAWCEQFVLWYNTQHMHSGLKFVTPHQRHIGEDKEILAKRHAVYQMARRQRPERWANKTRDWTRIKTVSLNPNNGLKTEDNVVIESSPKKQAA